MAEFNLTAGPPAYHKLWDGSLLAGEGAQLQAIGDIDGRLGLVSIAASSATNITALEKAIRKTLGMDLPGPRGCLGSIDDGQSMLFALARDQVMLASRMDAAASMARLAKPLSGLASMTDQSDAWLAVSLSGPASRSALQRFCPLDLHPDVFPAGSAARTVMEHIGAVILRPPAATRPDDGFWLFFPSSYAESFVHALFALPPFQR